MARAAAGRSGAEGTGKPRKPRGKKAAAAAAAAEAAARAERRLWAVRAGAVILGVLVLRLAVLAAEIVPVHFDEAQYWAYGEELGWGYVSKPPGVAALIRLTTELFGDTLFGLRLSSPLAHAAIAGLVFATAARLWDGRTGFWAAAGYTAAPGVSVSAMIVTTDPPMMVCWAVALYALVRAGEEGASRRWWVVVGAAAGLGMLAKYTALGFAAGAIGYGLFSAQGRDWKGAGIAVLAGLVVMLPNLLWNLEHGFATVAHVAEDADPGGGYGNPGKLAEFLGAQLGVIGPVFFLAILAGLATVRVRREDAGLRLIAWQTAGLLVPIAVLAFVTRAQPNWAAPAYVAGSMLAARVLIAADWRRAFWIGQVGLGAVAFASVLGLAALYARDAQELPRFADPFKKMRLSEPFCARALGAAAEQGADVLLSDSRRRLSECMFLGGLGWDQVAIWNPDLLPDTHVELVSTLNPGDDRRMLLAVVGDGAEMAARFREAVLLETAVIRLHADRELAVSFWAVEGFEGYGVAY